MVIFAFGLVLHNIRCTKRYTRTKGLYQHRDVDPRKLRCLILNGQLAPCFPGAEDLGLELDECPICFLFYPSLNRSKCCTKGICTGKGVYRSFLFYISRQNLWCSRCPFCKTSSSVVEYRGVKTTEQKGVKQAISHLPPGFLRDTHTHPYVFRRKVIDILRKSKR
ncbi:hypothetical protein L7F22_065312 [Adiantum nelumboides]|nr:hypothetical protein [Adiantum nelumboides]